MKGYFSTSAAHGALRESLGDALPNVSLGVCCQPGELHRLDGDWKGVRSVALGAPPPGQARWPFPPAAASFQLRPAQARSPGRGRAGGVSAVPPPPRPPPPTRCSLSCGFPPSSAAPSPESNYFSLRSFAHPPGPRGRSGGRAAAHFPPPEAEAGPLGRGERGLGGARGAADGTICPSAHGPAGPQREAPGAAARTPASSGMSGRGLARGFPAHARTRTPGSEPRDHPESFSWAPLFRAP